MTNTYQNIINFLKNIKQKTYFYNIILSFLCIFAFFTPDYILKISGASKVGFEFVFFFAFFFFFLIILFFFILLYILLRRENYNGKFNCIK